MLHASCIMGPHAWGPWTLRLLPCTPAPLLPAGGTAPACFMHTKSEEQEAGAIHAPVHMYGFTSTPLHSCRASDARGPAAVLYRTVCRSSAAQAERVAKCLKRHPHRGMPAALVVHILNSRHMPHLRGC